MIARDRPRPPVTVCDRRQHGQSEMRIIKTRLSAMLPGISVFLDVDNHGGGKVGAASHTTATPHQQCYRRMLRSSDGDPHPIILCITAGLSAH